nr:hypothetical protein [Tanacetum cinerariifolium]
MQAPLQARFSDLPADLEEACQKKRKRRDLPRTPSGSSPSQPPPPPPPTGASGAPGTLGASISSQLPPHPPPSLSTGTSGSAQQQDDSIPDEQLHLSDDEDCRNDHLPKVNLRKDWWKPLSEEERLATPEHAWIIPSSNVSDVENKWATTFVSAYETLAENSLLANTEDITNFLNWYCRQFQMEECYKIPTDQVDRTNPEGDQVRVDVNRPLPLGGPLNMILRHVKKNSDHTCEFSVSSELKPTQDTGHLDHLPGSDKRMLSTAVKLWTRNLMIRHQVKDFQLEHPSDTKVLTMKMEILLGPRSNKLLVGDM